jgi:hypothetical protein
MYTAIKGIFENGQVIFEEPPPTTHRMSVVVMFMEEKPKPAPSRQPGSLLKLGASQGKTEVGQISWGESSHLGVGAN